MVRKSQVKAIAARAKQASTQKQAQLKGLPVAAITTLTRSAKKKHVKRAKPLTKTETSPLAKRRQQDLQTTDHQAPAQMPSLRAL